ncbi:bifunctional ADP-dependent NAD(P)H-hydrate dehydratase/NAD(P)H-hydrate epimerase [Leisingera caerulea]|uniref:bifunctional ADP-dependent NAD(P)H-hydrate dehydratase/NAD(P)H-hydrate epimerase n=1 Tax=Leisingera caerulea TaxID=506591 RepID=UPI0003F86718|nr:bifunctional ADP-dependent NAD(P)H-hydrate dehydratase/NAD(P)H-hydrate epimerase [Leisingera caerulea]
MTELLTAAQMRAIEQAAIASGEVTGLELMERAGQGVVEAIFEEWPELAEERGASPSRSPEYLGKDEKLRRAVVLCGPGNNGGDGFVVARLLKERGWEVEVFLYGDAEKLPPDAKVNYERWQELGRVNEWDDRGIRDFYEGDEESQFLVIDALFGTGLTREMPDDTNEAWNGFMPSPLITDAHEPNEDRFVAIDFPSGICSDSGRDFGALPTHLTVTFHSAKIGHHMSQNCRNYGGAGGCGKLKVVSIGLPPVYPKGGVELIDDTKGKLSAKFSGHKYAHGHALVLSGGHGKTGAARLAARGALRIGAGLVTVGSPRSAMFENAANLTAIMLRQIDGAHGLAELLEDDRLSALCLGPGMGRGADTQAMVFAALKEKRPTVLDADALTRFELKPEALFEALHENCVITPHGGEFARLFPDLAEKLKAPATTGPAYSKVDATREAAKRAGCVVLFKGPDTVIAAPDGRCSVNSAHYERSAPWLATAGSGDVLAGFITGLMARGFAPMQAAETAAYIHVECALEFGPGLIAEDLPEQIPAVFRKLGL